MTAWNTNAPIRRIVMHVPDDRVGMWVVLECDHVVIVHAKPLWRRAYCEECR